MLSPQKLLAALNKEQPSGSSDMDRFLQALGSQNINTGQRPWNRSQGQAYAQPNAAGPMRDMSQPQMTQMNLGQQQRPQIQNPLMRMLMGG